MSVPLRDFDGFMDFGFGVDDVNGNVRGQAVTRSEPVQVGGGQKVTFICNKTESQEELQEGIGLTVEGSGAYGFFAGSDKFDLVKKSNFKSYSVFLFVNVSVENPSRHLLGEKLVDTAAELLAAGNTTRFREEFGDFYIKGIKTGGEYWAIVEIETTDSSDQTDISNKLQTAGFFGVGGADLATTFSDNFLKVTGSRTLNIVAFQNGGAGQGAKQEVQPGEVVTKAQNFPAEVSKDPAAFQVELQDYKALDIPNPPDPIQLQKAKDQLGEFARNRATLMQFLNDIAFIKEHPEQFESFDNNSLDNLEQQIAGTLNQITDAASSCFNDVNKCDFQPVNIPSRNLLPNRKAGAKVKVPNWVGVAFTDFRDPPSAHPDVVFPETLSLTLSFQQQPVADRRQDSVIQSTNPKADTEVPVGSVVIASVGVFDFP
jgi:hypothetical protein